MKSQRPLQQQSSQTHPNSCHLILSIQPLVGETLVDGTGPAANCGYRGGMPRLEREPLPFCLECVFLYLAWE